MTYQSVVLADSPSLLWMLQDPSGTTAADATGNGLTGTCTGGFSLAQSGPAGVGTAATFNGTTGWVYQNAPAAAPDTFSIECWFKTTTASYASGGILIGFGDTQNTTPAANDRELYMTDTGTLKFGYYEATAHQTTITSAAAFNDAQWHHVVGTFTAPSGTMVLYVDGSQVATAGTGTTVAYTGYWRAAHDLTASWPSAPSVNFFAGSICEVAVYPAVLTSGQVSAHYAAAIPGTAYAGAATDLGGGTGSWASPANAGGAPDAVWATWTAP